MVLICGSSNAPSAGTSIGRPPRNRSNWPAASQPAPIPTIIDNSGAHELSRDPVKPQLSPSVKQPSHRRTGHVLARINQFPHMLAAGSAKLRPTPGAKGLMSKAAKSLFDPKLFLAKVGEGTTILRIDRNAVVFSQGDAADTVFYIQKGRIKVLVVSEQGKEAVVESWSPDNSSAKDA